MMDKIAVLFLLFLVTISKFSFPVCAQKDVDFCADMLRSGSSSAGIVGPPGKKGPKGDMGSVGQKGDIGSKGEIGRCDCGEDRARNLEAKFEAFQNQLMGQLFQRLTVSDKVRLCEVGIKSGSVPDSAITASSYWRNHPRHEPWDARLDGPTNGQTAGCWGPDNDFRNSWIQVRLNEATWLTGVVTQGRERDYASWMTKYKVQYGMTEEDLKFFKEDGSDMIFQGNVDRTSYALGSFPQRVFARIIRIHPVAKHPGGFCMRFGVVSC